MYDSDVCTLCNLNVRGDEYHYILICPTFTHERELYLEYNIYHRPSSLKFEHLFTSLKDRTQSRLAKFVRYIIKQL